MHFVKILLFEFDTKNRIRLFGINIYIFPAKIGCDRMRMRFEIEINKTIDISMSKL